MDGQTHTRGWIRVDRVSVWITVVLKRDSPGSDIYTVSDSYSTHPVLAGTCVRLEWFTMDTDRKEVLGVYVLR